MSGGSAENGLIVAGCAQMAGFYDLPGSVAAGHDRLQAARRAIGSGEGVDGDPGRERRIASLICEAAGHAGQPA